RPALRLVQRSLGARPYRLGRVLARGQGPPRVQRRTAGRPAAGLGRRRVGPRGTSRPRTPRPAEWTCWSTAGRPAGSPGARFQGRGRQGGQGLMRWEVFKQDGAGKPHQAVGSVHAADAEGALLNARHVFARRPSAVSLWVAPAAAIHSWTAEQLERHDLAQESPDDPGKAAVYLIFVKTSNRRSMTFVEHVGEVRATGAAAALRAARQRQGGEPVLAWWLVPQAAVSATAPEDAESWFEPARDKTYKLQSSYGRVTPSGPGRGSR